VLTLEIAHDFVDRIGWAKAIEHDVGAGSGERGRDPEPYSTGRTGYDGGLTCQH
jgi:hypothetical protein